MKLPHDAICLECGYSLRGSRSNLCPECGKLFDRHNPRTFLHPDNPFTARPFVLQCVGALIFIVVFTGFMIVFIDIWQWAQEALPNRLIIAIFAIVLVMTFMMVAGVIFIGLFKIAIWNET